MMPTIHADFKNIQTTITNIQKYLKNDNIIKEERDIINKNLKTIDVYIIKKENIYAIVLINNLKKYKNLKLVKTNKKYYRR